MGLKFFAALRFTCGDIYVWLELVLFYIFLFPLLVVGDLFFDDDDDDGDVG